MTGIDLLLSKALTVQIKKNVEPQIERKLNRQLFVKYGISIKQSIEEFPKLEKFLYETLGPKTSQILKKCTSEIITTKKIKEGYILTIKDESIIRLFLKFLGDTESRKIITSTLSNTSSPTEILKSCKLPRTSGYRKLNLLIKEGFIVKKGSKISRTRRNIYKFKMFCDKFTISFEDNKLLIKTTVPKKTMEESSLYSLIIASS